MLSLSLFGFAASLAIGLSMVRATVLLQLPEPQSSIAPSDNTFHHTHLLPSLPEPLPNRNIPQWNFETPIADHFVCFRFHRRSNTLFVKPRLSSSTSDQIRVQLVGYKQPYEEGLESSSLSSVTGQLIAGTVLSLGKVADIQTLMRNHPFVYLMIEVQAAPGAVIKQIRKNPETVSSLDTGDFLTTELIEPPSPPMTSTKVVDSPTSSSPVPRKHPRPIDITSSIDLPTPNSPEDDSPPIASTHVVTDTASSPSASSSSSPILDHFPMPALEDIPTRKVRRTKVSKGSSPKQGTTHVDTYVRVILMLLAGLPGFTNLLAKVERADLSRFSSMQSYFKILNESMEPVDWQQFFDVPKHGDPKQFMSELLECLDSAFKGTEHYQQFQAMFYGRRNKLQGEMESFTSLNLIPVGGTMQQALAKALHAETPKTLLHSLPHLLIININRMAEGSRSKNLDRMSFQKTLNVSDYVADPELDCHYILHAVIVQDGTMHPARYTLYIMEHPKDQWIRLGDNTLSMTTEYQAMVAGFAGDKPAYMLAYIKESALAMLTDLVPKSVATPSTQAKKEGGRGNEPVPVLPTDGMATYG
jgi:hypothetical protein